MEIAGRVDGMQGIYVVGWAVADPDIKNCTITAATEDGTVVATGRASRHRADLANLRSGRANIAFWIALPGCTEPRSLHILADGVELPGSPVHAGPGRYDGHCKLDGRVLKGWVRERVPELTEPLISAVTQTGEIVGEAQSSLNRNEYTDPFSKAAFAIELPEACFGPEAMLLDILADGTKFAEIYTVTMPIEEIAQAQPLALRGGDDPARLPDAGPIHDDLPEEPPEGAPVGGFIDFYGQHALAGGWLFSGWVNQGWADGQPPRQAVMTFAEGSIRGEAIAILHSRADLRGSAEGVVFFVSGATPPAYGALASVRLMAGDKHFLLVPAPTTQRLRDEDLLAKVTPLATASKPSLHRERLMLVLARLPFLGNDTLDALSTPAFLYIDEAILCGIDGLALIGWHLARPGEIKQLRVRSGMKSTPFDFKDCIRIERHDVLQAYAKQGFADPQCGFVIFLPQAVEPDQRIYIEVETKSGEIGYKSVETPKLSGMTAIKRLLSVFDCRFADVQSAYDHVLGPAIEALNETRLFTRPPAKAVEYGELPESPKFSVIVSLYGRLDFVEYQLALFSAHPQCADIEFIYVLDDPSKQKEAKGLFASIYERFVIPFRAVFLEHNLGFAPANNAGLEHARGTFIAYLNSDVFPGSLDWLERLSERLVADPKLGVVGPLLVFEDESVQHRGMYFKRLPEIGNWFFCMHQDKGLRYAGGEGVQQCIGITGACMVMNRELAIRIGGFDETYIIGDFEDSDLCFKLQELGLTCAVDTDVKLYHLERKSQASSSLDWRMNLTVYNAWQHERRWAARIAAEQAANPVTAAQ